MRYTKISLWTFLLFLFFLVESTFAQNQGRSHGGVQGLAIRVPKTDRERHMSASALKDHIWQEEEFYLDDAYAEEGIDPYALPQEPEINPGMPFRQNWNKKTASPVRTKHTSRSHSSSGWGSSSSARFSARTGGRPSSTPTAAMPMDVD